MSYTVSYPIDGGLVRLKFGQRRAAVAAAETIFKEQRARTRVHDADGKLIYALYPNGSRKMKTRRHNPASSMWPDAVRYIGDAKIKIGWNDAKGWYEGSITVGRLKQTFSELYPPKIGHGAVDSSAAYDRMAVSAVSFLSYYTSHNRGDDLPSWAPPADFADALEEATMMASDEAGHGQYWVRRTKTSRKGRWVG